MVSTPFVRIGAVAGCVSCKHRYLIDATHIKRVPTVRNGAESPPETTDSGPEVATEQVPAPPADVPSPSPADTPQEPSPGIGGLGGLSEMMRREAQRERDSQFNDYDTLAPAPDAPRAPIIPEQDAKAPAKPKQSESQKTGRRRKALRGGYLLAAAVALALGILGIGLLWQFRSLGPEEPGAISSDPQAESDQPPEPVYEGPTFQGLPLVMSSLLAHEPWDQPGRPFVSTPPQDDAIFLTDAGLAPAGTGAIEYTARIVSERPGVLVTGELTLSLIDPQGTEVARTITPIALVSPERSLLVQVPIPANLDPTSLHVAWSVSPGVVSEDAVFLDDVSVTTQSTGADTMARVLIQNLTDHDLNGTNIVITAWDGQARPLRRWRVYWPLTLRPGSQVEFYTRTGVIPTWTIHEWTIDAAG